MVKVALRFVIMSVRGAIIVQFLMNGIMMKEWEGTQETSDGCRFDLCGAMTFNRMTHT
jgi:hypothetical protein